MTYILGRVQDKTSYIVGDSVITSEADSPITISSVLIPEQYSSFGESIIQNEYKVIQESTKKISSHSEDILIGFAGNAKEAYNVIQNLIESPKILEETVLTIEHFTRHNPKIQLLVSIKCADSEVCLYNYNVDKKNKALRCKQGKTYHLGSLDDEYKLVVDEFINNLFKLRLDDESLELQLIGSFLQTLLFSDTIESGIGGVYIGATHEKSIHYQKDIAYILMKGTEFEKLNFSLVGLFNRDDRTIVNSPFLSKPYRILIPYIPYDEIDKINSSISFSDESTWDDLYYKINNIVYDFYSFLYQHPSGVIRILLIPNSNERIKEILEIKKGKILPKAEEFADCIKDMLNNKGEFIRIL